MLSQTGTYALQAALHLARQEGKTVAAGTMAQELELPGTYLAKVLHRLVREGVLRSTRGPRGGYRLSGDPAAVTVAAVVAPFQELRPSRQCLLGGPCDLQHPCTAHERRSAWTAAALEILERTTLADLLDGSPLPDLPTQPERTEA
jgi:Rrf2 family protein